LIAAVYGIPNMSSNPAPDGANALPKILYLTTLYPAASHTFILREISALRALGLNIQTASIREPGDQHMIGQLEEDEKNKTFYVLGNGALWRTIVAHATLKFSSPRRYFGALRLALQSYRPGMKGLLKQFAYFAEAGIIASYMRKNGITHLHNHFGDQSATVAMLAAQLSGIPFSFTIHGPTELEDPYGWAMDQKIERSKYTVCISEYCRDFASEISSKQQDEKLYIIHCGVFPEAYVGPPPETRDGLRLVFVGRLDPVKGVSVLFDALDIVSKNRADISLDIIGGGSLQDALKERAQGMPGVTFHGYLSQDQVAEKIIEADALVLPSFAEGLPVVYMEALASERPAIATDVAGVSELIANDETGLLVEPGNPEMLAEAILKMASNPAKRREMGIVGRKKVSEDFDIREEAKRMKTLYFNGKSSDKRPEKYPEE